MSPTETKQRNRKEKKYIIVYKAVWFQNKFSLVIKVAEGNLNLLFSDWQIDQQLIIISVWGNILYLKHLSVLLSWKLYIYVNKI